MHKVSTSLFPIVALALAGCPVNDDGIESTDDTNGGPTADCADISPDYLDGGTVSVAGAVFPVCVVNGLRIMEDVTWTNDRVFLISGTVNIGDGDTKGAAGTDVTLTIEPGTQIYADAGVDGTGTATSLVATRGGKLNAVGTAELPIIFGAVEANIAAADNVITDTAVEDLSNRGQWGGVILSGRGKTNAGDADGELLTEASPEDQERYFGGTNNADSSGSLKYVIIAESGAEIRPDEEIQGLTLEAAGSGTTIEYLQVLGSEDDAIEWFGGAAGGKYLLIQGYDDDGFDQDLGWQGKVQYAIAIHGKENGDYAMESDSNGSDFDADPRTTPTFANVTLLGDTGKEGKTDDAVKHREGWGGQVFRSAYTGFDGGCLDVDDQLPASLAYADVVFDCGQALTTDDDTFQQDGENNGQVSFVEEAVTVNATTLAIETTVSGPFMALPDGFDNAGFIGAVDPTAETPWWSGWTYINSKVDGNLPGADFHPLADDIAGGTISPVVTE